MASQNTPQGPAIDKNDIAWLLQQPGVSGVLTDKDPLYVITTKDFPPDRKKAIEDRLGANRVDFHPDGPIRAQPSDPAFGDPNRTGEQAPERKSTDSRSRVSGLRQFRRDSHEE